MDIDNNAGVTCLQIGVVNQLVNDPDKEYKVMVTIPGLNNTTAWARLGSLAASNNSGICFYPEIGDEVILGFINNDIQHPVILGSLYSKERVPVYPPSEANNVKAIISYSGVQIVINEAKKSVLITTPGQNSIELCDESRSVTIKDQHANIIKMSGSGIELKSSKDITLSSSGDINLNATGNINIDATTDISLSGLNILNSAQVGFEATGNATAELSATGQTVVKGAIVRIN